MTSFFSRVFFKHSLTALLFLSFLAGYSQAYNMATGTVTTCTGTFYDNGGPSANYIRSNVTETFVSATGDRLKFDFTTMTNLNGASLSVYDGPTTAYPLIGVYSGSTFSVESTGSSLTFVFTGASSGSSTSGGWVANISCTTPTLTPYTMTSGTVTACSGVFHDPAGPAASYANGSDVTQTFSSGSAQFINFTFTNFDVALGDTLLAYDGTSISAPLIGKYTGSNLPEIISSRTGSSLTFRFTSNTSGVDLGWQAIIGCSSTAIVPTAFSMQSGVRSVCTATFYDNGGPSANYIRTDHRQTFTSATGSRLKADFTTMTNLNGATLSVYDGPTTAFPLIGVYSGTTFSVESTGPHLTFLFNGTSSGSSTSGGWVANISCTTPTLTPYTMTSGTVTACSGVFHDPAGPAASYTNGSDVTQTFSSGSSQFINFTFTNFDMALGDTLLAYDGTSISAPLIGKYTGSNLPEIISSRTGSSLTFRFTSNTTTVDLGWQAIIGCSSTAIIPTAFSMQSGVRSVCTATFYDNGGPSANYIRTDHRQTFTSATGSRLKADFTTMTNLNGATLSVYDGPTTAFPLIGVYSGTTFSVESTGPHLTLLFNGTSSGSSTSGGWVANISCTTPTLTPYTMTSGTVTTCSGVFHDPAGPAASYANGSDVTQTFSSGSSQFINFTFTNFDMALGDTLLAYDGTSTSAPLIGKYTGSNLPEIISSRTGSSLTFRFTSNTTTVDLGWQAIIGCSSTAIVPTAFSMQSGVRSVCTATFYDNGGPSANYIRTDHRQTFTSATGSRLKADFTTMTNLNGATLSVYDGPTTAFPLIGVYSGTTFSVESTGPHLTFLFNGTSSGSSTSGGWVANISCTTPSLTPYTMTSGTVTTCSGVFHDPAGPAASYANGSDVTQTFSSGSSQFINFTFTNFDVALGDTLLAYDGTSTSAPLIGKYTGYGIPEVISSRTGSSLTFRFKSNTTTVDQGWQAIIGCSSAPIIPATFSMQSGVRSVCSGTFYDNGGPSANYIRTDHRQTFTSATGNRLRFDFTTMTNLNGASLSVYDGPTTASPIIGSYSGSTFSVQSTGSHLTFVFNGTSSGSSTSGGWVANISCISAPVAPVASFSTTSYTICSGSCISFNDLSSNSPNAWAWQFQGASVSTSTLQNPTNICYNTPGTYTVSLTASNGAGSSTSTNTITVLASPAISIAPTSTNICQGQSTTLTASGANTYTWSTGATSNSISVSPFNTATYTVTGASINGCQTSTVSQVVVRTTPAIFIGGGTVACPGQSLTLSASGASTYTWSTGATSSSITVSPTSTTVYSITALGSNGCGATASTTITIGTTPTLSISGGNTALCAGQPVSLSASGASSYTWSTGSTANTITVSPTATTNYTLTGSSGSCNTSIVKTVSVNPAPALSVSGSTAICPGQSTTLTATGAATYTWSNGVNSNSVVLSPSANTSYTLTGGNAGGCTSSTVLTVSVGTMPVISISNANPTICAGKSATLTATGASSYTWSTNANGNSIVVSPGSTTSYSVTGRNAAGCSGTAFSTVTVNASPVLNVSSSATLICIGENATLSASGATSYSWNTGATGSSISVTPITSTAYTVTGTGTNGCSSQLAYTQQVSLCTGIEAIGQNSPDKAYPNPFTDQLSIELTQAAQITVHDVLGRTLFSLQAESGLNNIDTRELPAGVYYVEIRHNKTTVFKLIKH